jgi:hypothetical protein
MRIKRETKSDPGGGTIKVRETAYFGCGTIRM